METSEKRRSIKEFPKLLTQEIVAKYFNKCIGFLSDGDLTVSWNNPEKELARPRLGTPPFMSVYLLQTLGGKAVHSPIDDLESFIWVFFWAILSTLQLHGAKLTKAEGQYWSCLRSRDLATLINKQGFLNILRLQKIEMLNRQKVEQMKPTRKKQKVDPEEIQEPGPSSCGFEPFVKPLFEWLQLAFSGEAYEKRFELRSAPTEEYKKIVLVWIAEYLSKGINHLDELPETWQYMSQ
ncbi:hypothetical protein Clacol_008690 [Clathrus columnatus]|uniref:Fungal-type protein kinase domain-containing protein n=1 Tax=Clathrus columnatus TaxID=1419009 RepID=A0AAV5ANF7_9AGAM|nr:hypothetical protein Clacol_008690 [Clathrus columnatus]